MKNIPRISEMEWQVMKVLWTHWPRTAAKIIAKLGRRPPGWHPKTGRTLINRLTAKKTLGFRTEGRTYVYRALAKKEDCVGGAQQLVFGASV